MHNLIPAEFFFFIFPQFCDVRNLAIFAKELATIGQQNSTQEIFFKNPNISQIFGPKMDKICWKKKYCLMGVGLEIVETVSSSSSSSCFNMSISIHTQLFTDCKEVPNILLTKIEQHPKLAYSKFSCFLRGKLLLQARSLCFL